MYGFLLQDWTTIRFANTVTTVTQSEANWVSLQPYQDIVFFLEVREVTLGSGVTAVTLDYQTAPMKDEALFVNMVTGSGLIVSSPSVSPIVNKVLLASATVPLARWVRWKLTTTGTPTTLSDVTFRLTCAANAVSSLA